MSFSDDDLHDTLRFCMETLIFVAKNTEDQERRVVAAVNLANIVFEIQDRQNSTTDVENFLQDDEEENE